MTFSAPHSLRALCLTAVTVTGFATVLSGCQASEGTAIEVQADDNLCEDNEECGEGFICVGGVCEQGQCDPSLELECDADSSGPYCCKSFQNCNVLDRTCIADPDAPLGGQCEVSDDCPGVGDFCSGGSCYSPAGREPCTASYQCPSDERCDLTVFLCVPDNGGCNFCADLPELCCEDEQICDQETGFCNDIAAPECTEATAQEDCRANQQCDSLGRCVQCIENADCGPGTECNVGTGNCFSVLNRCESDADCDGQRLCAPATNECVNPQCERDVDCEDRRELCDTTTYTCYLPPAVCEGETDEPNDSVGQATAIQGSSAAGTLCRGNTDYLTFPIAELRRYRVTVEFPDFTVQGVSVALLDGDGIIVDSDTFGSFDDDVTVTAITPSGATGNYTLRIVGTAEEADQWSYTVAIEDTPAPEAVGCEIDEPNDGFADAFLIPTGVSTFSRCGDEEDLFRIEVPPLNGVEIDVNFENEDGDLVLDLYDAPQPDFNGEIDHSDSSASTESVQGPELPPTTECLSGADSCVVFYLRVSLYPFDSDPSPIQSYTITVTPTPRPAECLPDPTEPDDVIASASTVEVNGAATVAKRCTANDVDVFAVTIPASSGGSIAASFDHSEGDLRIDLRNANGDLLDSSNRSTTNDGSEVIDLPFNAEEVTYYAVVRIHAGTGSLGQEYSIGATAFDASACVVSEPVANNDFVNGQCLGSFESIAQCVGPERPSPMDAPDLAACTTAATEGNDVAGCGTSCGAADEDWFRVGKLNNGQTLTARLAHDATAGVLGLSILRGNADLSNAAVLATETNAAGENELTLTIIADTVVPEFAREYAVVVRPEGTTGYQAQPYSLDIEIGDECLADANESPDRNDTWPASTRLRTTGDPAAAFDETLTGLTRCAGDTDVFELYSFVDEVVTITYTGPAGMTLYIGERPGSASAEPVSLVEATDTGNGVAPAVELSATLNNDANRQLFFVLKGADANALGDYSMQVQVTPAP